MPEILGWIVLGLILAFFLWLVLGTLWWVWRDPDSYWEAYYDLHGNPYSNKVKDDEARRV